MVLSSSTLSVATSSILRRTLFLFRSVLMEHDSLQDPSQATFSITEEDHTVANALRYALNQEPRVTFVGYSIPHPSDARVNIRVQTTEDAAREVLKYSCKDLMSMCETVVSTFEQEVIDFKKREGVTDASEG